MPEQPRRRRTWHYVPRPQYRASDISAYSGRLYDELLGWVADATVGNKAHRLHASNDLMIARSDDEMRCDVAQALAKAPEWDGFSIAHELKLRGWPADVELVQLCNRWSCALLPKILAARRARAGSLNPDRA